MPFMMRWPGQIEPGLVFSKPVSTLDILPTVAAACDVSTSAAKTLDGVDLIPFLKQQKAGEPHEALFWKLAAYSAVRVGNWKLYLEPKNNVARLYDLDKDPGEKTDMAKVHPGIFEDLKARYTEWNNSLPPRAWTNISPVFKK